MTAIDPHLELAGELAHEGRHEEALPLLLQSFSDAEREIAPTRYSLFMLMFRWRMLVEDYPAAGAALRGIRDAQAARVLAGDLHFGQDGGAEEEQFMRATRFSLIVDMNEMLRDPHATCALFMQIDATQPELARRYAWGALPAIVEVGEYALAERYQGEPLALLGTVNDAARSLPLFPPPGAAPRLAAEMMSLLKAVHIAIAVLRGQGHEPAALTLREALLAGLATDEMRELARQDLDAPGAINRAIVARQMAHEHP